MAGLMRKMMQYRPQSKQTNNNNIISKDVTTSDYLQLCITSMIRQVKGLFVAETRWQSVHFYVVCNHPINTHNTAICWLLWLPEKYLISLINMSTYCLYEHNLYLSMRVVTGELKDGGKGVVFTNEISIYDVHTYGYSVHSFFSIMYILRGKGSMLVHDTYQPCGTINQHAKTTWNTIDD